MSKYIELIAQRAELDKEIEQARKDELSTAIAAVKKTISDFGLTAEDCGFSNIKQPAATQSTKQVAVYYRTPDGTEWSGRGRTPVAILALVNAGQKLEDFLTEEGKVWFAKKQENEAKKSK